MQTLDTELFRLLNGMHTPACDSFMVLITKTNTWLPLYALIIIYLVKTFRKEAVSIIICIALLILLADQFASGLIKPLFARLRPSHVEDFQSWIHLPDGKGGKYGFISSHAANTFALAMFLHLLLREKTHRFYLYLLWFWAFLVSYSRIYVGVHYPLDIFFGGLSGVLWAFLSYRFVLPKVRKCLLFRHEKPS
jgi:undecaprenyl-diphosphatase